MRQVVTPNSEDLSIHIPREFIGKKIEVVLTPLEEADTGKQKPSDFFGYINSEEAARLRNHIQQARNEWDRSI